MPVNLTQIILWLFKERICENSDYKESEMSKAAEAAYANELGFIDERFQQN